MSATLPPRFTFEEWSRIVRDPILDDSYQHLTGLGPTVRDYLAWKRLSNAAERTLDTYERDLARLCVECPHLTVETVAVEDLILVLEKVPRRSWKRVRAAWSGFFKWAIRFGHRSVVNPVELLPDLLKQRNTPVHPIFSVAEQQALVNASRFTDDPARDRMRVLLLLSTGIRKGEARRLRVSDVDPTARCVVVFGKGDKQRLIPVRGDFWRAWEEHLLTPIPQLDRLPTLTDHVWFPMSVSGAYRTRQRQVTASHPERPMSERGFHEWWVRLVTHAGVTYRKPHMTRHTFATDALDASEGNLHGVKELLGHASTETTELYLHSSKRHMESVAEALNRARRHD